VLLSQVPSKTIDIRFIPIGKIIKYISNRNKDIKKIAISILDTLLKELEGIVRLSISKI
jgi:hypothetical protein